MKPAKFCKKYKPCSEAARFARQFETMSEAWEKCPCPDWMLWALERMGMMPDDKILRLFACWCARSTPLADGRVVWDLLTDERSRNAMEVAERHASGQAGEEELDAAGAAAWAAAWAAARDAAGDAAGAAAWAAAWAAARAAAGAAAWAAAWAAARAAALDAARDAAWAAARDAQADRLREIIPNPFEEGER